MEVSKSVIAKSSLPIIADFIVLLTEVTFLAYFLWIGLGLREGSGLEA